jgi:hypothetical protein
MLTSYATVSTYSAPATADPGSLEKQPQKSSHLETQLRTWPFFEDFSSVEGISTLRDITPRPSQVKAHPCLH